MFTVSEYHVTHEDIITVVVVIIINNVITRVLCSTDISQEPNWTSFGYNVGTFRWRFHYTKLREYNPLILPENTAVISRYSFA